MMAEWGRQTYKQVISMHCVRCHGTGLIGGTKGGLLAKPRVAIPSKALTVSITVVKMLKATICIYIFLKFNMHVCIYIFEV